MGTSLWDTYGNRRRDLELKRVLLSSVHFFTFAAEASKAALLKQTSNGAAGALSVRGVSPTLDWLTSSSRTSLATRESQTSQELSGPLFRRSGSLGRKLESGGTLSGRIWLAKKLTFLHLLNNLEVENDCPHCRFIC